MRIAMLFGACVLLWAGNVGAVVITTADNKLDTVDNSNNSGFWSPTISNEPAGTNLGDNYSVGLGSQRNFFTFDLATITDTVVGAVLSIPAGLAGANNNDPENLTFFDVTTDPAVLNNPTGTSQAIFDDLGSGTVYGQVAVPLNTDPVIVSLNADAIAAINAADGFFSIGGMMDQDGANVGNGIRFLFGLSQNLVVSLDLTVEEGQAEVPEPASLAVFATALVGLGLLRRRRARG